MNYATIGNHSTTKKHKENTHKKSDSPEVQRAELAQRELLVARVALLGVRHDPHDLVIRNEAVEEPDEGVLQRGARDGEGVVDGEALVLRLHAEVVERVAHLDLLGVQLLCQCSVVNNDK